MNASNAYIYFSIVQCWYPEQLDRFWIFYVADIQEVVCSWSKNLGFQVKVF